MNFNGNINTNSAEYTCVLRLVNHFLAVHVKGQNKTFISKHPERDFKVAQLAALTFANSHNIPVDLVLKDPHPALLTVLKHGNNWYPAEIHADKLLLLERLGKVELGATQSEAIKLAKVIALSRNADCIPSIGISMAKN